MATRFAVPITQLVNDNALSVASGWKLNFYTTGTLVRKDTFSDNELTTANANPVIADSAGRFGDIFLESGTYKVVLTDESDVEKWTADPVEGSIGSSGAVDAKTTSYTVVIDDSTKLITFDATSAALTASLPAAATAGNGFEVSIKKIDSSVNFVTVDPNGSETVDGDATYVLTLQDQTVTIRSDGSNWQIISISGPLAAFNLSDRSFGHNLINGHLVASVASNALTIAVKNNAGNDPSVADPVKVLFRNATAANGDFTVLTITAATSLVISSGSTMGASNGVAFDLWVVGFNDAGTFKLAAINPLSNSNEFDLNGWPIASATADDDTGGSDSAHVFYAESAVSSKAFTVLGFASWTSGLTTAGTWDAGPDRLQLLDTQTRVPGETLTLGTEQATTSGTAVDFTGIPAGTKRITVSFASMSLSGSEAILVQLGDSGGIETSGYVSSSGSYSSGGTSVLSSTAGHILAAGNPAQNVMGQMVLTLEDAANNVWVSSHSARLSTTAVCSGGGENSLSDELTQLRVTRTGSDTLDAGAVNVLYE